MTHLSDVLDGLAMIEDAHRRQSHLCDLVEGIARELPRPCPFDCRKAAALIALDPPHMSDEDLWLFPPLRGRCGQEPWIRAVLSRRDAQPAPAVRVAEAAAVLGHLGNPTAAAPPEAAARGTLRTFVAVQRRHLDWESRVLLSLAREMLEVGDRADLADVLLRHRGPPPGDEVERLRARRCPCRGGPEGARMPEGAGACPRIARPLQTVH